MELNEIQSNISNGYNSKNPERGGAKKDNTGKSYQERKLILKTYAKDGQIYATAI